jgi:hypothetical protein
MPRDAPVTKTTFPCKGEDMDMCRKDKPKATCEVEEERSTMKKSRL